MSAPSTAFIIPAFNAQGTIGETLASLVRQTEKNWEAIVVDDGSSDHTAAVVSRSARGEPRIRLVSQPNRGASAARNRGLRETSAERVVFLDADDWVEPDYLRVLLPMARRAADLPFCAFARVSPDGRASPPSFCAALQSEPMAILAERCEPAIHSILASRQLIEAVGGFDEELICCEDWDLWIRLVRFGASFHGTERVLASYRMRPGSLSSNSEAVISGAELIRKRLSEADPRVATGAPRYLAGWRERPWDRFTDEAGAILAQAHDEELTERLEHLSRDDRFAGLARGEMADLLADLALRNPPAACNLQSTRRPHSLADVAKDILHNRLAMTGREDQGRWRRVEIEPRLPLASLADLPDGYKLACVFDGITAAEHVAQVPAFLAQDRDIVSRAVLSVLPLAPLIGRTRAYALPSFWAGSIRHGLRMALRQPGAFLRHRRAAAGQVLRAGIASAMRITDYQQPPLPRGDACNPVLLFPEILPPEALRIIDCRLGVEDARSLLRYQREQGYSFGQLAQLHEARADGRALARTCFPVFTHLESFLRSGVLQAVEDDGGCDVLLRAKEIEDLAGEGVRRPFGRNVRLGLLAFKSASDPQEVLSRARRWVEMLHRLNGDERALAVLNERPGWNDLVMQQAGFEVVLAANHGLHSATSAASVTSCLPVSSRDGIGAVIERMRAAS